MINSIRTESVQVLLFVCGPLLLLLIGLIMLLIRGSRSTATFPSFSVTVSKLGHEETHVVYRTENEKIELDAEIGRGKSFFKPRISVLIPINLTDDEVQIVVKNTALGLAKLHYEYLIYQASEPQIIPQEERNAAIVELRQMGFEIQEPLGQGQISRAVTRNWQRASRREAKTQLSRVQTLMSKASGIRENIKVLATSE